MAVVTSLSEVPSNSATGSLSVPVSIELTATLVVSPILLTVSVALARSSGSGAS